MQLVVTFWYQGMESSALPPCPSANTHTHIQQNYRNKSWYRTGVAAAVFARTYIYATILGMVCNRLVPNWLHGSLFDVVAKGTVVNIM